LPEAALPEAALPEAALPEAILTKELKSEDPGHAIAGKSTESMAGKNEGGDGMLEGQFDN
jgi:hypothetical protein